MQLVPGEGSGVPLIHAVLLPTQRSETTPRCSETDSERFISDNWQVQHEM